MGAWIETIVVDTNITLDDLSHPTWVRGLKHSMGAPWAQHTPVAPYVGAWIETGKTTIVTTDTTVAPYVGAWIETQMVAQIALIAQSHPTWVRGLKHDAASLKETEPSRTLRGCVD